MLKKEIQDQESLTVEKIKSLRPLLKVNNTSRPIDSFINLMDWTIFQFANNLKNTDNIRKIVHNKIIIDGLFLEFCKEKSVEVISLYEDSIVSWKHSNICEKFFMQGVFLIKSENMEFIHAALYHKGNQNEDEVSFFIILSDDNYNSYINFRNEFDNWSKLKDRKSLFIRVVEDKEIAYTKDNSWDDLFLPLSLKKEVKSLVENFLASEKFFTSKKIPWKRGFILYGEPGNGKTSIIKTIISNYDFKPVTIISEATNDMVREAFSYAEDQSPSLLYFEDLDSLLEKGVDISTFLNLMDGISAKNGILVIATANNIKKLKSNITNRPSRFDRKFEIPLPDQEMATLYLKKWFGNSISLTKIRELAKKSVKNKFSYAYLKDIYISSMFEAISHNREIPNEKDIECALKAILRDKNILNTGISTDKYLK